MGLTHSCSTREDYRLAIDHQSSSSSEKKCDWDWINWNPALRNIDIQLLATWLRTWLDYNTVLCSSCHCTHIGQMVHFAVLFVPSTFLWKKSLKFTKQLLYHHQCPPTPKWVLVLNNSKMMTYRKHILLLHLIKTGCCLSSGYPSERNGLSLR